jgi:hypothetical protein
MPQSSFAPLALGAAVVLVVGVGVAGSIALANPPGCEPVYQPGKASSLVTLDEDDTGVLGVNFPTPLKTTGRELSVVIEGEGAPSIPGGSVDFDATAFLGTTGEFLDSTSYEPRNPTRRVVDIDSTDFFSNVLGCVKPGSTLVVTTTVEDLFGPIIETEDIKLTSTVIVVFDIRDTYEAKATGSPRLPQSGMPTVVTTPEGVHGVSFPNQPAPTELRVSVLKQGDGPAVQEGDFVTTHFTGLTWNTQQIFVSSFGGGAPLSLVAIDSSKSPDGQGVIPGIAQALIGQAVGSQVLVSIPPELGYPVGQAPSGVPDRATLVYVFDILGTKN